MHEYIMKELTASHCVILIILHFNDNFLVTNFSQPHGLNFSVETAFKGDISYCSPDHDIVNTHVVSTFVIIDKW